MSVPTAPCMGWTTVDNPPALTTVYTPAPSCSDAFVFDPDHQQAGPRVFFDEFNPLFYECLPSEYDAEGCSAIRFSPGWCPEGWTAGNSIVEGEKTTATCCMSGFTASKGTGEEDMYINCLRNTTDVTAPIAAPDSTFFTRDDLLTTVMEGQVTADHRGWVVTWDATDLSLFVTAETGSPEGNSDGNSDGDGDKTDDSAAGGQSPQNASENSKKGLRKGAIAGIVVGIVGALVLAGVLLFFCRRRRGRTRMPELDAKEASGQRSELSWSEKFTGFYGKTPASNVSELESNSRPVEVPANQEAAEVPGDSHLNRTEVVAGTVPNENPPPAVMGHSNSSSPPPPPAVSVSAGSGQQMDEETERNWVELLEEERRLDEQKKEVELKYLEREMQRARERRMKLETNSSRT